MDSESLESSPSSKGQSGWSQVGASAGPSTGLSSPSLPWTAKHNCEYFAKVSSIPPNPNVTFREYSSVVARF
jgi:hypothetical protein